MSGFNSMMRSMALRDFLSLYLPLLIVFLIVFALVYTQTYRVSRIQDLGKKYRILTKFAVAFIAASLLSFPALALLRTFIPL